MSNISLRLPNGNFKLAEFSLFFLLLLVVDSLLKAKRQRLVRCQLQGNQQVTLKQVAVWQLFTYTKSLALIIMLDPEVTITHIRENIQQKIKDAGYATIEKFAYENNLTKSTITRAINGSRNPRLVTLIEIANALNINLSELLDLCHIEHPQARKTKPTIRNK
jgi:DNA-binding phage protein